MNPISDHQDNLPEWVTADYLAAYGITSEDVRRRCPHATEYGRASAPYWHRNDLAPLFASEDGRAPS